MKNLHGKWKAEKTGASKRRKEIAFVDSLDDLFDVAEADAMKLINIEEDRKFLEAQREKSWRGCMGVVDTKLPQSQMDGQTDCWKIHLYRSQFRLTHRELSGLRQSNVFVIKVYVLKSWFACPSALSAPRQDLELLHELVQYKTTNEAVANGLWILFFPICGTSMKPWSVWLSFMTKCRLTLSPIFLLALSPSKHRKHHPNHALSPVVFRKVQFSGPYFLSSTLLHSALSSKHPQSTIIYTLMTPDYSSPSPQTASLTP